MIRARDRILALPDRCSKRYTSEPSIHVGLLPMRLDISPGNLIYRFPAARVRCSNPASTIYSSERTRHSCNVWEIDLTHPPRRLLVVSARAAVREIITTSFPVPGSVQPSGALRFINARHGSTGIVSCANAGCACCLGFRDVRAIMHCDDESMERLLGALCQTFLSWL